jgi:hypothetical protein
LFVDPKKDVLKSNQILSGDSLLIEMTSFKVFVSQSLPFDAAQLAYSPRSRLEFAGISALGVSRFSWEAATHSISPFFCGVFNFAARLFLLRRTKVGGQKEFSIG